MSLVFLKRLLVRAVFTRGAMTSFVLPSLLTGSILVVEGLGLVKRMWVGTGVSARPFVEVHTQLVLLEEICGNNVNVRVNFWWTRWVTTGAGKPRAVGLGHGHHQFLISRVPKKDFNPVPVGPPKTHVFPSCNKPMIN